ncbi:MAG TPA: polysaccharide deacetylase family protein [Fimbriimonadaceae bacterium]|nr:polysaccharide deacetylase family protein [Fimbriimonadaceae bacterium]
MNKHTPSAMSMTSRPPAAPVLMYHRIGRPRRESIVAGQYVPAGLFERHMRFLKRRGYEAMDLGRFVRELACPTPGMRPLAITFDDGYESTYREALPILNRLGMTATVFVVAGCIGLTNAWDEAKGDVSERIMTADQIVDAHRRGLIIASHTTSHCDLVSCADEDASEEIRASKEILEGILGSPVEWFSYPYGREDERIRALVRSSGYLGACGTHRTLNTSRTDPYSLARLNVRSSTSVPWLIYKLARARRDDRAER